MLSYKKTETVKKFILILITIFLAYLTAFYTTGKEHGYSDPFAIDSLFNNLIPEKKTNFEKGINYFEKQNYDKALNYFFDALSDKEQKANYYIGYIYNKQKNYDDAMIYLEKAVNYEPENADAYLQKGIAEYNLQDYTNAVNDLYFSTELNSENPEAYYYLAESYYARGKNIVALQAIETALEYDSLNTDYHNEAASIAYNAKDYEKALFHYKKYADSFPDDKYTMLNIGLCYNKTGNKDSAVYWYDKTIEKYPDYSMVYNNKGWILQTEGKYDAAIKLYDKALKYDSSNEYAVWNRADSYFAIGKYDKAIKDYQKAYNLNNDYYNALYYIALCYEKLNDKENALKYYQQFLQQAGSDNKYFTKAENKIRTLKR